jgi:hypothetical protein
MSNTATPVARGRAARIEIEVFNNHIDGRWSPSQTGALFDDINPVDTGDIVGRFYTQIKTVYRGC